MKNILALTLVCGALTITGCTTIPECSDSMDLDCNVGAYSEERTFEKRGASVSNINPAAGDETPAPVEDVIETITPAEPVSEVIPEPAIAPAPAPVDTQIIRKADETPAIKTKVK